MSSKPICSIVLALFLAVTGLAQSVAKQPKAVVAQKAFNVGEIQKGKLAQHTYVIKNEGSADLEIKNVAPT